jgi:hypothetical protein
MGRDILTDAAFGGAPERWPLPAAHTPEQRWRRAVAAGGQGRYASADTELERLLDAGGSVASLAHSTRGSLLRQLGGHRLARGWDGRALALATDAESRADALTGLAADALGLGRFAASAVLLRRAAAPIDDGAPGRCAVRLGWVGAELAMATGDGAVALERARHAVALAADLPSVRHRVKSAVVLAAAQCCAGNVAEARALADDGLAATARHGLVPLRWALASLLAGIGSATHIAAEVAVIRDEAAELVRYRGGVWRS